MSSLSTQDQATALAHQFLDCADAFDRRLVTDRNSLSGNQQQELVSLSKQLRAKASLTIALAAQQSKE